MTEINGVKFIQKYVDKVLIRVIKRDYFKGGRWFKYTFIFKGLNIDMKRIEKEIRGRKKNKENYLSKKMLNTSVVSSKGNPSVT